MRVCEREVLGIKSVWAGKHMNKMNKGVIRRRVNVFLMIDLLRRSSKM